MNFEVSRSFPWSVALRRHVTRCMAVKGTPVLALALALVLAGAVLGNGAGCVDTYSGTRLEANLSVDPGFPRDFLVLPTPGRSQGDPGYYSHYEIFARIDGAGWVRLQAFLIRPAIEVDSPCQKFVPEEYCIDVPELPCDPFMNPERFRRVEQILGVISVAATEAADGTGYDHVPGWDYAAWPDSLFVDPTMADSALKLARENLVQSAVEAFCRDLPHDTYLGNGAQLTFPFSGRLMGVVDGPDPRTGSTIGGFSLNLPGKLKGMTELLLTREKDPARLSPELRNRRDLPPGEGGQVLLVGQKGGPLGHIRDDVYRGVVSVQLESPYHLPIHMHVIVFEDIDEDPIKL